MAKAKRKTVKKRLVTSKKKKKSKGNTPPAGKKKITADPLPARMLRWRCQPGMLPFASTSEIEPLADVVVQKIPFETMRFGLETRVAGHNIFIRGVEGTKRVELVKLFCEELKPTTSTALDRCFVHNFSQPDRPRLISVPPGRGRVFQRRIDRLAEFIRTELKPILASDVMQATRETLASRAKSAIDELLKPFEQALNEAGLALVTYQAGSAAQVAIFPVLDGKSVPPEELEQLCILGQAPPELYATYRENAVRFEKQLDEVNNKTGEIKRNHDRALRQLVERTARWILKNSIHEIREEFPQESVREFLEELVDDLVQYRLTTSDEGPDFTQYYRVNVVIEHGDGTGCPVVTETLATMRSLLGTIDFEFGPGGEARASHMGIRAGSVLRADGGILIIDVRDLLKGTEVWNTLVRTLRTGKLEIVPSDYAHERAGPSLQPQAIPVDVKVVLIGDVETYHIFCANDHDFSQLFKVIVDIQSVIPRDEKGIRLYAQFLARLCRMEKLPPFDNSAVLALAEQGARIAGKGGKLTTRVDRLSDIAGEAAYLCAQEGRVRVTGEDVEKAVRQTLNRADQPARQFRELQAGGKIRVQTRGMEVGQINGTAVMMTGLHTYGLPARITATIGPGTAGVINIEREAALSGAIHTKGFYILGGLMRNLLRTDHPLAFDASVAFEQSYGGIDGDSASGAEICCLLSALTGIPLRQDVAMTGAIDQMGYILAVGAVNEKIEGFFDTCRETGLTGTQGMIIPGSNVEDLMLREDVVEACGAGQFSVYGVDTVHDALEILTGIPAGRRGKNDAYPKKSLLGIAVERARDYWVKASKRTRSGK
jgi:ATP-dependent Lon protease